MIPNNYLKILPNNYNIYYENINNNIIFYINKYKVDIKNIKETIGYIILYKDKKDITLLELNVNNNYIKNGIGSYLILLISEIYKKKIKYIYLDDMSDNPWKENNIYKKLGFYYINEYPEPEMKGNLLVINNNFKYFLNHYKSRNFFLIK